LGTGESQARRLSDMPGITGGQRRRRGKRVASRRRRLGLVRAGLLSPGPARGGEVGTEPSAGQQRRERPSHAHANRWYIVGVPRDTTAAACVALGSAAPSLHGRLLGKVERPVGEPVRLRVVLAPHMDAAPVIEPPQEHLRPLIEGLEALVLHPVLAVQLPHHQFRVHAQLDPPRTQVAGGPQGGDGGQVLGLVVGPPRALINTSAAPPRPRDQARWPRPPWAQGCPGKRRRRRGRTAHFSLSWCLLLSRDNSCADLLWLRFWSSAMGNHCLTVFGALYGHSGFFFECVICRFRRTLGTPRWALASRISRAATAVAVAAAGTEAARRLPKPDAHAQAAAVGEGWPLRRLVEEASAAGGAVAHRGQVILKPWLDQPRASGGIKDP